MTPVHEARGVTPDAFAAIRDRAEPTALRGAVAHWPVVRDAPDALFARLSALDSGAVQGTLIGKPGTRGRFFYSSDYSTQNYEQVPETLSDALARLRNRPSPDGTYIQSIPVAEHMPGFADEHALGLVPDGVAPRAWIGTPTVVQTHFDPSENIAAVVLGRRRVTLFPPEALPGLYPGPFETAPGRVMVSRVDVTDPDRERFPRYAEVEGLAREVVLERGDALYIPYGWWHRIEALAPLNMLVNYWWTDTKPAIDSPMSALILGHLAFQHLSPEQARIWREVFAHFVFGRDGEPMADLPQETRGFLAGIPEAHTRWAVHELLGVLGPAIGLKPPPRR